jgi:hypothetical protein
LVAVQLVPPGRRMSRHSKHAIYLESQGQFKKMIEF